MILHNDVYTGGNQNADVGVYMPVFHGGELVAWLASKGHVADIGGMTAGGYDPNAREVWQEAFRIPPLKLVDRGDAARRTSGSSSARTSASTSSPRTSSR